MSGQESPCRRREPRFKSCDEESLLGATKLAEQDAALLGAVIDISPSGLRLLCEGDFKVGQTFSTELITDRSHGTYRGVIRRVEPWTGGNSVLGCQLLDKIPTEILGVLAQEQVVNRRQDDRVDWHQSAKISWELQPGEFDVEIHDCSPGGLKVSSQTPLPEDLRLRIRVEADDDEDEEVIVDARSVWQLKQQDGMLAGLAFTRREVPEAIRRMLSGDEPEDGPTKQASFLGPSILVAAAVVILGIAMLQTGVWG